MIFSERWLRELVNPEFASQELMDRLTMAGLEVDGFAGVAKGFEGVVVGEVTSVDPHPDADKLRVCQVSDGSESFQVVCGAPNVRAGLKVPFATIGAQIIDKPDDKPFKIKKAKLRGVESNGMLCSAEELGVGEDASGIMELPQDAQAGEDFRSYLGLDDLSIELDLTPNRGDCLGMRGLAREVGVIARLDVREPEQSDPSATIDEEFPIEISAKAQCPRYLGRIVRGIDLNAKSPQWMQERLRRSGLRSIDPVVDVTNYVLMELGQPLHAFDFGKLSGKIDVRMAGEGEKLTLLDGKEVNLTADTLVIADDSQALAMAGIMGGLSSAVSDETRDVFLECAFFSPLAIAGKARSYGMHTDASHRYERGVDYQLQARALARATELLLEISGGEAGPVTEAMGDLPEPVEVKLNYANVERILGVSMEIDDMHDILRRLGFTLGDQGSDSVVVGVPSFRFDVSIEADLIEELARIYGYDNLPQRGGLSRQQLKTLPEASVGVGRYKNQLVALGYQEIITYSFIEPKLAETVCAGVEHVELQNPISADMSVMRSSLLPGLLSALKYNENRQQERLRLFESGLVFASVEDQPAMLAGLISGEKYPNNWSNNKEIVDFYDVKGDVEALLNLSGPNVRYEFVQAQHSCLHDGQCARVERGGKTVGHVGALHPAIHRELGLTGQVYLFELSLAELQQRPLPVATKLSIYPEVSRDLAILVDAVVPAEAISAVVRKHAGEQLSDLRIFDVYQGDAIEKSKKSLALGLTWQHPSRTLSDEDINSIIGKCVNALESEFNANLRQ